MSALQSIRGMPDILPDDMPVWHHLERVIREVVDSYGYSEIRFPVMEKTELFSRSVGEATDIVAKEMYSFDDRNGDSITLRPEGTAACARACLQHGLLFNQTRRLWYMGPMFRHERPQKGRQRQFQQFGVEAFGMDGPDIDAELIMMCARLWRQLGVADALTLELNNIGQAAERAAYGRELTAFLQQHRADLDEDSQQRLERNPLRILDSKDKGTQAVLRDAPLMAEFLGAESQQWFEQLCEPLQAAGIEYTLNPRLMRGLDYYNLSVFEWTTDALGAQGTVCGGGRYDGLVEQLGGKPVAGAGFALGMERLGLLLETLDQNPETPATAAVYIVHSGANSHVAALQLAERLRDTDGVGAVQSHCGGGGFKSQFKKADKAGATVALILGEQELTEGTVTIKHLRDSSREQQTLALDKVAQATAAMLQN